MFNGLMQIQIWHSCLACCCSTKISEPTDVSNHSPRAHRPPRIFQEKLRCKPTAVSQPLKSLWHSLSWVGRKPRSQQGGMSRAHQVNENLYLAMWKEVSTQERWYLLTGYMGGGLNTGTVASVFSSLHPEGSQFNFSLCVSGNSPTAVSLLEFRVSDWE